MAPFTPIDQCAPTTCHECNQPFKLIRENVVSCKCITRFLNIAKIIKEYEDKYLTSLTIH